VIITPILSFRTADILRTYVYISFFSHFCLLSRPFRLILIRPPHSGGVFISRRDRRAAERDRERPPFYFLNLGNVCLSVKLVVLTARRHVPPHPPFSIFFILFYILHDCRSIEPTTEKKGRGRFGITKSRRRRRREAKKIKK
jgi:hypothetical protein